jgi:hypothetical protein
MPNTKVAKREPRDGVTAEAMEDRGEKARRARDVTATAQIEMEAASAVAGVGRTRAKAVDPVAVPSVSGARLRFLYPNSMWRWFRKRKVSNPWPAKSR